MEDLISLAIRLAGGVFVGLYVHAAVTGNDPHLWMLIAGLLMVLFSF